MTGAYPTVGEGFPSVTGAYPTIGEGFPSVTGAYPTVGEGFPFSDRDRRQLERVIRQ